MTIEFAVACHAEDPVISQAIQNTLYEINSEIQLNLISSREEFMHSTEQYDLFIIQSNDFSLEDVSQLNEDSHPCSILVIQSEAHRKNASQMLMKGADLFLTTEELDRLKPSLITLFRLNEQLSLQSSSLHFNKDKQRLEDEIHRLQNLSKETQGMTYSGIWEWDIVNNVVTWDDTLYDIFEVDKSVTPTFEMYQHLISDEDREQVLDSIHRCAQERGHFRNEYQLITPKGRRIKIQSWGKVMVNAEGDPIKMFGVCMNITNQFRIQNFIDEITNITSKPQGMNYLEKLVQYLTKSLQVKYAMISEHRPKQKQFRSLAFAENGKLLPNMSFRDKNTPCYQVLTEGLNQWKSGVDMRFDDFDELKMLGIKSYIGVPLEDDNGNVIGVFCLMNDREMIDDNYLKSVLKIIQKRTESELKRSQYERDLKEYLKHFALSTELHCIATPDGYFKKLNSRFSAILGYTTEELVSKPFLSFVHPDDIEATKEEMKRLAEGKNTLNFANRYRCKNGTYRYLNWSATTEEETGIIYAVANDVTTEFYERAELERTSRRLSLATQAAKIGIWDWNLDSGTLNWDSQMMNIYQTSESDFDGTYAYWEERFYPEDLQRFRQETREAVESETPLNGEYRIIDNNDVVKHIRVHGIVERNGGTNSKHLIGLNYDITALRRAELATKFLHQIILNESSTEREFYDFIRRELHHLMEYDCFYIAQKVNDCVHFLIDDKTSEEYHEFARVDGNGLTEFMLATGHSICLSGNAREFQEENGLDIYGNEAQSWLGSPIKLNGAPVGVIACQHYSKPTVYSDHDVDILNMISYEIGRWVEKQRTINELKDSRERYRNVVNDQSEFIVRWKPNGEITFANLSFLKYHGVTFEFLKRRRYQNLVRANESERFNTKIASLTPENPVRTDIRESTTVNNKTMWQEWTDRAFFDKFGRVIEYQSIGRDITERIESEQIKEKFTSELEIKVRERTNELLQTQKQLRKALRKEKQLSQIKSRFVSTASHQFRTPMAIIQSNSELLELLANSTKNPEDTPERIKKAAYRINAEVARMTQLMDEILVLGKISSGAISPKKTPTDLVKLIKDQANTFNELYNNRRTVRVDVEGSQRAVKIDPNLIEHALSNLINNALKYSEDSPKNPEILVDFHEKSVNVTIRDYGIGIPQSEVDHLFQPFFRASNVSEIKGTGLGLNITQNYLKLNNGDLQIDSQLNVGTTCKITLKS